jgi:hypothetical protein
MARNEKLAALINKIPHKFATKAELAEYKDKIMERDTTMVTGIFRDLEIPGSIRKIPFRLENNRGIEHKYFMDGQEYTIPYAWALHLDQGCNKFEYQELSNSVMRDSQSAPVRAGVSNGRYGHDKMMARVSIPRFAFICADLPPRPQIVLNVKV